MAAHLLGPMKLRRPTRFVAALVALFGMLFMQLAVAGYVCKAASSELGTAAQAMPPEPPMYGMPDCGGLDMEQPGLCSAHAQTGNQSLDKPYTPAVAQFIPTVLAAVSEPSRNALAPIAPKHEGPALARSIAPPLSISNCCFRN